MGWMKGQHGGPKDLAEATDVFIHFVSRFGTKEASGEEPDSKPNIGETPRSGFETVDSAENLFGKETQVSSWLCGEGRATYQQRLQTSGNRHLV